MRSKQAAGVAAWVPAVIDTELRDHRMLFRRSALIEAPSYDINHRLLALRKKMPDKAPAKEGMLWNKVKLYYAIAVFLVIDLAFVLVWGGVLYGFDKAVQLIDPTNSFFALKVIKYISELSTGGLVIYSIVIDSKSVIRRIAYEHREDIGTERAELDGKEQRLEGTERE